MSAHIEPVSYRDPLVNIYVDDVETMASFYKEHFGFVETFRTPPAGVPDHVEVRLGAFTLGLASVEAARSMHQLPLDPGLPRSEIALWTTDVDTAYDALTSKGVRSISPPHDFIGTLRAAWLKDPEGNHIQIVSELPSSAAQSRAEHES